uniref:Receptor ligand binding region domain-containing protein n=1 Tax=Romanomermis culicivorax TaxID=13658 RepID=A0A915JHJ3_ROMCU
MSGFLLRVLLFYVNAKFLAADDSNESQIWPSEIRVGAIHSFLNDSPALYTLTLKKALSDLKYDGIVPKNVKFNDRACDEQSAMYYSWKFFHENRVDVFIGPECSPALATTALFASSLNIPAFAPFSMMDSLGDKRKYTTLTRVSQYLSQVIALATLIDYFNWTRVAVVRASGTICDNCLAGIQDALDYHGITLATTLVANFSDQANLDYTLAGLQASARSKPLINQTIEKFSRLLTVHMRSKTLIVIVCGGYLPSSALPLLLKAYDQNMTFPNYVYIIPVYVASTFDTWLPWLNPPLDNTSLTEKYIQAYRSVIVTDSNAIVTQAAVNTSTFIDEYVAQHKDNFSNYSPTLMINEKGIKPGELILQ